MQRLPRVMRVLHVTAPTWLKDTSKSDRLAFYGKSLFCPEGEYEFKIPCSRLGTGYAQ